VSASKPSAGPRGLAVREQGPVDAPLVVLVHGGMDRSSGMRRTAGALASDFRVVTYDRRGYGRSVGVGPPFTIDEQVADLLAVMDERPAVVFGHSIGGDVALAAAERHPALVRSVGTYEAPMSWEPWWPEGTAGGDAVRLGEEEGPAAAADAFARRMIGDRIWDRLPPTTRAQRLAEGPALVGELSDLRRRPPYDPARITVPVLVARGERCAPQHLDGARILVERLTARPAGSVCELVVVPDVGHGVHLDRPDALAGLVRRLAAMAGEVGGRPAIREG
jgi:pimeloyl-ACP methyl ester carboxylesterase